MPSSCELKYHPEAAAEILPAIRWYLEKSSTAAIDFFEQLRHAEQMVQQSPEHWGSYLHGTRVYRLNRFPYGLVYQVREGYILVVAVAHLNRKPGYWKDRLPR
jgi:hypothetical protein